MSDMGFQTFIGGTSFDVLNSMAFNYVIDVIDVSGTGSKAYNDIPDSDFYAAPISYARTRGSRKFTYGQSGQTLTWDASSEFKMVVYAVPKTGSSLVDAGFTFQAYVNDTPKLAPNFTPFCLVQVIDLTINSGNVIDTVVPSNTEVLAFIRGTDSIDNTSYLVRSAVNGKWRFTVGNTIASSSVRIYLFAKYMVNTPEYGFFLYYNDAVVWHSNCLPLNMQIQTSTVSSTVSPLAVLSSISSNRMLRMGANQFRSIFFCTSAGKDSSGVFKSAIEGYAFDNQVLTNQNITTSWWIPQTAYIETAVYDQYYKQSLGLS